MTRYDRESAMPLSIAKRKERLLREGAAYRAAIEQARVSVSHNLHADVLARSLVTRMKGSMFGALSGLVQLKGNNVQTLLPIALSAISFATKAKLLRPLLRIVVVLGVVGAGFTFIAQRKKRDQMDSSL